MSSSRRRARSPSSFPVRRATRTRRGYASWALRDDHGTVLGNTVLEAVGDPGRELTGHITSDLREVTLPLDILDTPANLAAVRAAFEVRMLNPAGLPAWYIRHGAAMIDRIDDGTFATSVQNPSQVWRIGGDPDLQLAFLGGELVSGYGAFFRQRFGGAEELLIGGYANETNSYIPANNFLPPTRALVGQLRGRMGLRCTGHRRRQHDDLSADRAFPRR